jgi:Secretion system C-terminal sorting domain
MKNFKLLILVSFHFLALIQGAYSQVVVTSANPNSWSLANVSGFNTQAPSAAFLAGLNYNLTPVGYPGTCSNINSTPAAQMTVPAPVVCGAQNQTRYYMTTFNLNNDPFCYVTSASIRADDAFRIFINGTQVGPGTLTLACSGNNLTQLNGNNWNTVYTLPCIQSLLVTGQNTIIIEVPNCATISYLSALFTFNPLPALPTGNHIHFSTNQGSGGYQASLWGVNPKSMKTLGFPSCSGVWTGNWTIESSSSSNGPWTPFTNNSENTSSQTTPWLPPLFLYGKYYRVTYQITTTCGTSSANSVYTFFVNCQGCLTNGGIIEQFVQNPSIGVQEDIEYGANEIIERDASETQTAISEFINYAPDSLSLNVMNSTKEIFQKAYVDQSSNLLNLTLNEGNSNAAYVEIYSILGKMIWAGYIQEQLSLDISTWADGVYIIHGKEDEYQIIKPKKVLICRNK